MENGLLDAWLFRDGACGLDFDRGDGIWIDRVRQVAPNAQLHVVAEESQANARLRDRFGGQSTRDTKLRLEPRSFASGGITVDGYLGECGIRHLAFLRIGIADIGGVLAGAARTLRHSRVDVIEFDLPAEPRGEAARVLTLLHHHDYVCMYVDGSGPHMVEPRLSSLIPSGVTIVATHRRLVPLFQANDATSQPPMLDLPTLLMAYGVKPRGAIHLGAHYGKEANEYLQMGMTRILFVEANPDLARALERRFEDTPGVTIAGCAITDADGPVVLRLASVDQSSSILPMKRHLDLYSGITEVGSVAVPGYRLDTLMAERGLDAGAFNFMSIDIQGAELMALRGAEQTLRAIDAVNVEINFDELYEGCAQIEEIDEHLNARGLYRVATTTPYDPSWGDALYVRRAATQ